MVDQVQEMDLADLEWAPGLVALERVLVLADQGQEMDLVDLVMVDLDQVRD